MNKWLLATIVLLSVGLVAALNYGKNARKEWEKAMANVKAYNAMLGETKKKNAAFQLTLDQLKSYQDTILRNLDATRKELKIKEKNVQSMHYVYSTIEKIDTVNLIDTVFREPAFHLDTLLGDEWCKTHLTLKYPSMITVHPEIVSKKHIIVSTKKETVNPPKKFWLFRLFQRKHRVLKVDIKEENPYIKEEESKYFEVL